MVNDPAPSIDFSLELGLISRERQRFYYYGDEGGRGKKLLSNLSRGGGGKVVRGGDRAPLINNREQHEHLIKETNCNGAQVCFGRMHMHRVARDRTRIKKNANCDKSRSPSDRLR